MILQKTLKQSISTTGIGLHGGKKIRLTLHPAPLSSGIVFERLEGEQRFVRSASPGSVLSTAFCTTIGDPAQKGVGSIATIEHLLSALSALEIDNVRVEVEGPEIPIMDGSAGPWLYILQKAGIVLQDGPKRFLRVKESVCVQEGDAWARLSPYPGLKLSCDIAYDHPAIPQQVQSLEVDLSQNPAAIYEEALSRARTYGFLAHYEAMRQKNLALGGSLDNALVFDDYKVMNEGGLRYPDEVVRHKMLDSIGDLYLLGANLIGAYAAYKPGHGLNLALCRALLAQESAFEWVYGELDKHQQRMFHPILMGPFTGLSADLLEQY